MSAPQLQCTLCGRRGVRGFLSVDPRHADARGPAICSARLACDLRRARAWAGLSRFQRSARKASR